MSGSGNYRKRRWTRAQKEAILKEFEEGSRTCSELAGHYRVSPVLIYKWRKAMRKEASPDYQEILTELEEKNREIEHLQKALGESVIKIQVLMKANDILKKNVRLKRFSLQKKS